MHNEQYPSMPVHPLIYEFDSVVYPPRLYENNKYWSDAIGYIFKVRVENQCTASDCPNTL